MNLDLTLSVIVPVYNIEKYLRNCITSIINQSYLNLDVILIDDGSTDNSGKICDEYKDKDARIRVVHKKNEGLVSARFEGIQLSRGDLITFVDGDDVIEKDMYQKMLENYAFERPDIISSGLKIVNENDTKIINEEVDDVAEGIYNRFESEKDILGRMMWDEQTAKRAITSSVCTKIFKKDLLLQVIENVDKKLTFGEDAAITYPCFALAVKVMVFHQSWYHYICRNDSMVRTRNLGDFEKIYFLKNCLSKQFEGNDSVPNIDYQIEQYVKVFLKKSISELYQLEMAGIEYLFPYSVIPFNSKIVIYGAGKVGKSYLKCLRSERYAEVVAVADKGYKNIHLEDVCVISPQALKEYVYDYILIAVNDEGIANEITEMLREQTIESGKIIWKKPKYVG